MPLERPNLAQLARAEAELPACVAACPVARRYLDLLGSLDWDHFPERDRHRPWPGSTPAPRAPFVAAYLVKLDQDKRYMSDLRSYLVDHPALGVGAGLSAGGLGGAAVGLRREGERAEPQAVGTGAAQAGQRRLAVPAGRDRQRLEGQELPPGVNFGDAVSLDTKHILAWVKREQSQGLHR